MIPAVFVIYIALVVQNGIDEAKRLEVTLQELSAGYLLGGEHLGRNMAFAFRERDVLTFGVQNSRNLVPHRWVVTRLAAIRPVSEDQDASQEQGRLRTNGYTVSLKIITNVVITVLGEEILMIPDDVAPEAAEKILTKVFTRDFKNGSPQFFPQVKRNEYGWMESTTEPNVFVLNFRKGGPSRTRCYFRTTEDFELTFLGYEITSH